MKQTANKQKSAKAIVLRSSEEAMKLYNELTSRVNAEEWLKETKNGALKLTTAQPELTEDNKGTLRVGGTTFYKVSAGTSKTALLISYRSYLVYLLRLESQAKRLAAFPTFEEWCKKNASQFDKFAAVGIEVTEEQKRALYDNAKAKLGETIDDEEDSE